MHIHAIYRFPQIRLRPGDEAVYQESGAVMLADVCVESAKQCAEKYGANVVEGEFVTGIDRERKTVTTDTGRVVEYDKVCACLCVVGCVCMVWVDGVCAWCGWAGVCACVCVCRCLSACG